MSNSDNERVTAEARSFLNRTNTNYSESQKKIDIEATKMKLKDARKHEGDCVEELTAFLLNQNLKLVCLTNDVETGAAN